MRTRTTSTALLAAVALVLAPTASFAQRDAVPDKVGDAPAAVDISQVKTGHRLGSIRVVAQIPDLDLSHLSGTEVLIKTPGIKKVYAVTVLRDRDGDVVSTSLSWRPKNDPVEPKVLPCDDLRTTAHAEKGKVMVMVAKSCLTRTSSDRAIKALVRVVDGTSDLAGSYWDDQAPFSPKLAPGRAN